MKDHSNDVKFELDLMKKVRPEDMDSMQYILNAIHKMNKDENYAIKSKEYSSYLQK